MIGHPQRGEDRRPAVLKESPPSGQFVAMTPEERIIALERQLIDCRSSAVSLVLGMAEAIATTPGERRELARWLEDAAATSVDLEMIRLAKLLAEALRRL